MSSDTFFYIDSSTHPDYPASYVRKFPTDESGACMDFGHRFMIIDDSGEAHAVMLGEIDYTNEEDLVDQINAKVVELDL